MKTLKEFDIKFTGLSLGKHSFDFEVKKTFFEAFEYSDIQNGEAKVSVTLEKMSTMMTLEFCLGGRVDFPCDKCLDDVSVELEENYFKLFVKFGDDDFDETDEVIVIPNSEYSINIAQYIYEFINLSLPAKKVHPEGECNREMVEKLSKYIVEESVDIEEEGTDPRWDALKNIKLN